MTVIEATPKRHPELYTPTDWQERDNFPTQSQALGYVDFLRRQYPMTPYRIEHRNGNQHVVARWVVLFVPEWRLK